MIYHENIPINDSLLQIVEEYVEDGTSKNRIFDKNFYKLRLRKQRYSNELIERIIDDLDKEVSKEKIALQNEANAKLFLFGGLIVGVILMIITVLSALGLILNGTISYLMFGAIASSFLASLKGYNELKDRKKRKELRSLFWRNKY